MRRHNSEESFCICEMGFSEAACLHRTWEEKVCNGGRMLARLADVEGGGGGCSEEPGGSAPPPTGPQSHTIQESGEQRIRPVGECV